MNGLIIDPNHPATMSSREIADLVESRHDNVKRTMERLSERGVIRFTPTEETSHEGAGARSVEVYRVNKRDSFVVVAQLCPEFTARLVDRWQELEALASRPMTAAEQLLASVQLTVDLERRQRQTEQQVAALVETIGDMDRAHPLLDSIPNGMESITAIRQRIGKLYGLPPRVIDAVVREMPHSPRPFAMVRSKHEELNARPFAVWSKAEISRVFERFAQGCTFVTQHRATHPDFQGGEERFQMRGTPAQELQK
ncbi:Rha family transcriptional regulator [Metapseudomonas otitidis]|uniref:Rha family transcriptional regulator n=1 Tax=Metapseudomonas otitidis TaxID=319939 RepID=UPI00209B3849|nr:Rha family transcriptional regulator [Pseudomonas otitidis]MCO7557811.1 Rha family transcriptional regulator [Pseudomonas otitidis]